MLNFNATDTVDQKFESHEIGLKYYFNKENVTRWPYKYPSSQHINDTKSIDEPSTQVFSDNTDKIDIDQQSKKIKNFEIIEGFQNLKDNWDGEGAKAFNTEHLEKIKKILERPDLVRQPDIFPTFRESIQLEYEKGNGDYLEIEVFFDEIHMLLQKNDSEEETELTDINSIVTMIINFYDQS